MMQKIKRQRPEDQIVFVQIHIVLAALPFKQWEGEIMSFKRKMLNLFLFFVVITSTVSAREYHVSLQGCNTLVHLTG